MRDLDRFREAVREHRRSAGRTQRQLARAIGLHPDVLSHKLNGSDHAVLTTLEVIAIVSTLAGWASLRTRAEAEGLLALMDVPPHAISGTLWAASPLSELTAGDSPVLGRRGAGDPTEPDARFRVGHASLSPSSRQRPRSPGLSPAAPPEPSTSLIGRTAELHSIGEALSRSRLVTLTGTGGVGKTRLAVEAARAAADRSPRGVAYANLAAVRDARRLPIAIARSLGLEQASSTAAEDDIVDALIGQPLLLVLDGFEQVLGGAVLLTRLLAALRRLRILTTSRIPLGLYGEAVLRVPALEVRTPDGPASSPAVRLFVERARASRADLAVTDEDLATIVDICEALDGLPLGIELAAARTRLYPLPALRRLLTDRLSLLTGGPRDHPQRQQTLRATLDWSHRLLDVDQRQLFAYVGAFSGPFDAAAAAAVCGDGHSPTEMLARLEELSEQSLLEVVPAATPRFRLLETVREYAHWQLARSGCEDEVRLRHLEYYLTASTAVENTGQDRRAEEDGLEAAYPNLRAALDFAQRHGSRRAVDAGLRLAIALVGLWQRRGPLAEGVSRIAELLAADARSGAATAATRRRAMVEQAMLECFRGEYVRAATLAERGRSLCQDAADHHGLARAYRVLGEAALAVGDLDAAEPQFHRQLSEAELTGWPQERAAAYNMIGQVARHRGRYDEANALLYRGLRLYSAASEHHRFGTVLNSLGEVARDAGDADRAGALFLDALHRHQRSNSTRDLAYDLEGLAATAGLRGDGRRALRHLGAAHALRGRVGGPLPPVERAILTRILEPAVIPLSVEDRNRAIAEGRRQPVSP